MADSDRPEPEGDLTLRYMSRFHCIGPECEDNCCHSWRVEVDQKTYDRLKLATRRDEAERKLFDASMAQTKHDKRVTHFIKMKPSGLCPFLELNGLCHIQANFGEAYLSNVCASYPRRVQRVGERTELTGMVSCPEVTRQLILHEDAVEFVPWDRKSLARQLPYGGFDTRDVRPYWRLLEKVRAFMLELLGKTRYSVGKRFFFMTYFGNRTAEHFNAHAMKGNPEAVLKEMDLLRNDKVLEEIGRRLDAVETPSALVLLLARELVRGDVTRSSFRALVQSIFESYANLMGLIPDAPAGSEQLEADLTETVWADYRKRRARVLELAGPRVDQYLHNFAFHYWVHRLHFEAPDLLVHMLRLLCEMAVHKFLLFSHPWVMKAFDKLEIELAAAPKEADSAGGEGEAAQTPHAAFIEAVDRAAVDVFYKTARHIEHSTLLKNLELALAKKKLKSLAGAVYLIRF